MIATQDENKQKFFQFLEILSKKHSSIQYTNELGNKKNQLNFFDTTTTNGTNSYDFKIL